MSDHMRTELVIDALEMTARNHDLEPGCIMHSDRGTQGGFNGRCNTSMIEMLRRPVESTVYPTRKKAIEDIARYIELHYNRLRIHSGLGYRTPHEVRNEYLNGQFAA
ncbi:hypothetical protein Atai01_83330 [Amycolatopsis taiwanensis]|uniref:Integrase catalytic domain-containing protein n=2 Tax=Amycolatopsis taiwanensis TaxID=342230 RepID=A0A9W6R9W5_9PSEU|nr:hypothetical protein Atai01_83330 [Amycolatopsis taiwanensis]